MFSIRDEVTACARRLEERLRQARNDSADGSSSPTAPGHREIADRAVDGVLFFRWLGAHPTPVGRRNIDWSGAHHAHQEWPAQLNRFFQLEPLARAYAETGDERYAQAARDYIEDWIRAHPHQPSWTMARYDNTLNLSLRIGHLERPGWLGTLPRFLRSPSFDDAFLAEMVASASAQLNYEMAHMPNGINWRIAASDCLIAAGLRLAFLPRAKAWLAFGVACLNDAWHRQILPDGVHEERNPSYHTWMTRVMTVYCDLKKALPELGLVMEPQRVAAMWDYALASTRPNGAFNALHDCTGERHGPWNETRPAAAIRKERAAFRARWGLPPADPPLFYFSADAGQALWRTGWGEDDTYVTFDATLWGGGHCHLSRNSLQLHAFRQTMVADPGSFSYERRDPFSAFGKSTPAHSTVCLNGFNQSPTNPSRTTVFTAPGYGFISSDYEGGYWEGDWLWGFTHLGRGIWASHWRCLLWIQDLGLVVGDSLQRVPTQPPERGDEPPVLECLWQLAEQAEVAITPDSQQVEVRYGGETGLRVLLAHRPDGSEVQVIRGQREPLRGWMPGEGRMEPAPQLTVRLPHMTQRHEEFWTVLIPWGRGCPPPAVRVSTWKEPHDRSGRIRLDWATGASDEIHWTYRRLVMLGEREGFETDAGLVHRRRDAEGRVIRMAAIGGTYLRPYEMEPLPAPGILVWSATK